MNKEFFKEYTRLIQEINRNKEYGFNLSLEEFILRLSIMNPQAYSPRIERRIAKDLKYKLIPSKLGRGDMLTTNNKYIEFKASLITEHNDFLNIVQLRLWQQIDYYLLVAFDIRDIDNIKIHLFLLNHEDMCQQAKLYAGAAHGTNAANLENKNIELRMSIKISDNKIFNYWVDSFSIDFESLKML